MKVTIANDSGSTRSTWMSEAVPSFDTEIPGNARPDVCVIGAGIAGLSVALKLVQAGLDVLVLERGPVGGGQTARTSAHLSSALDDRFYKLARRFGREGARLAGHSHAAAIDAIEETTKTFGIDCDFRRVDGYLFAGEHRSRRELTKEYVAARRAEMVVEEVPHAPLPFDTGRCVRFANQAEIHPLAYLRGLADAIVAGGGRIVTGAHVVRIAAGSPVMVETAAGRKLRAGAAVDATDVTITSLLNLPTRQAAYRSYVMAFDITPGYVPHGLYWDTEDPYHYVRVARGEQGREVLIVGGEDHRVGHGDPERAWPRLEEWVRDRFYDAGGVVARWSGQIMEPVDGLAYIGEVHDNVYVATGDSGHGLTHATIAGMIIPDLVLRREHPYAKLYAPHRSRLRGLATFAREAVSSNLPYRDWLARGDEASLDAIAPGHGATVRKGLHLVAAYRDEAGTCHTRSARCPHMSGIVRWNEIEKTWDCPCHGSRFDAYGRVLNGPAVSDLSDGPADLERPRPVVMPEDWFPPKLA